MGTYYRYVNFTRKEFVSLSGLRAGGDKENAAIYCAPALAWLLVFPHSCGDGYRGRWHARPADDVRVVTDGEFNFYDMDNGDISTFPEPFLNVTPGLLQSMRRQAAGFVGDYHPWPHDVVLDMHDIKNGLYRLRDSVRATCLCDWQCGPFFGENRDTTLERVVSDHVTAKQKPSQLDSPFTYRADLSSDDVCDLIDALDEITGDKGREFESESAPRLIALRDRLADLKGTR